MTFQAKQDLSQTARRKTTCRESEAREREVLRLAIRAILHVQAQRSNSIDIRIEPIAKRQALWLDA